MSDYISPPGEIGRQGKQLSRLSQVKNITSPHPAYSEPHPEPDEG